ncbi:Phosphoserine transaminase [Yamadazyma tenuis]|uniref:phosphoserine transaminase n=1 Tax=Candida tenuis (strain ATCC 10573 / BCRC 21748 / CBS 615 / JCM 9827 / NBRC 10315 / NRRL Y-1498 / VKM Y-70) TaxID=590646 RepID=G3BEZ6_CANTC|nr:3-phosphoserine transaminase [Yamadazyma tenuis ATCC 10573]EGV59973.1 3-phosphoserine transaminase [Yamadazyma tenuis ATCC 10573]WEJ94798.1 Phosphoserine transaminase [Yamadazyma tenuis]
MSEQNPLQRGKAHYFGAGPALLPTDVLQQAALDLISYNGENVGIGEISHRSKPAIQVIDDTKANLTKLLDIPDTHEVFFMQGGGTSGFSSIAYNLMANYATKHNGKLGKAAYAVTGSWSEKSLEEAVRLGFDAEVVVNTKNIKFSDIPSYSEWKPLNKDNTAYLYICDNETVNGNEFKDTPPQEYLQGVELVADMSSNIVSKRIDVSKYGLIMAGAQKNIGLAGLTIYIIKKSLLEQASDNQLKEWGIPLSPIAFHYPTVVKNNSAYNTIPIFTCQILKLVTAKLLKNGGISAIQAINEKKAEVLYGALTKYPSVYSLAVKNSKVRSNMNVVFTLNNPDLDSVFLKDAGEKNLQALKGHRSVGGMRASIYNAVQLESVELLAKFVIEFAEKHK